MEIPVRRLVKPPGPIAHAICDISLYSSLLELSMLSIFGSISSFLCADNSSNERASSSVHRARKFGLLAVFINKVCIYFSLDIKQCDNVAT